MLWTASIRLTSFIILCLTVFFPLSLSICPSLRLCLSGDSHWFPLFNWIFHGKLFSNFHYSAITFDATWAKSEFIQSDFPTDVCKFLYYLIILLNIYLSNAGCRMRHLFLVLSNNKTKVNEFKRQKSHIFSFTSLEKQLSTFCFSTLFFIFFFFTFFDFTRF